ncbi:D-alanyl-D-alanine carboxypeptidase/D-alanyl-D-alanine endopeptidase [Serratia entomophila]|uniref:D-alanyl-D-alanine carboxypeptidase/D-alanyl-D-alanine endopeptidase n=1 Tax=Serratia entomophila TaxID=42906 RepID=UPI00217A59DE|nr:D-alanyl-D-alanine carboxypeptidase/D-alanyl-D-alanine-endopeptidase [Serratia entomophila]CAI0930882.1 D-alanyl-D-alanine carboxypeptidase dacC precursor [Serratia entomophila]CAI0935715.1 D-alanyl-D-alanine carboxypeptidase dacC precursor [Serratia entomophila]CAI0962146.1 D-alanyl-D-alanine carboxypeptidase dacC precursor [Serratia entomophila]CAI1618764.1 D-alanyl-D-alanine carboxypeptidase dacC precursor [Serratia entomophila]CAI1756716.1 D-alanyl-D-alanine carboxypeptidase dacC precur
MLKTAGWLLPAVMALAGCSTSGVGGHHGQSLNDALAAIGQNKALAGASGGIMVRDAASGSVLYQADADRRLVPASNMKLFTSLAAFGILGADYRFETRLLTAGKQHGERLRGDIYLQGSGDPTLHPDDLEAFAAALAQRGIRQIDGRLILDGGAFDNTPFGAGWSWDDETFAFAAPISALNYSFTPGGDINVVRVDVQPGSRQGAPGKVTFYPAAGQVEIVNDTATGETTALAFERRPGSNRIVVSGTIGAQAATDSKLVTIDAPAKAVGALLQAALRSHGIRLRDGVAEGATPAGATELAEKVSEPLSRLAVTFLKVSNNGYGEILTKTMGRKTLGKGDWPSGLQAIGQFVHSQGVNPAEFRQVDGSGLSRMNQVTPHQLTTLLLAARKQPWFAAWRNALPVAGEPGLLVGGTLRNRMVNTPAAGRAYAKSGSLTGVSSLSGYVDSATGRPLVFSIINNNYLASGAEIKALEDRMVETLAACDATVVCR